MIIDTIADNIIAVVKYNDVHLKLSKSEWMSGLFCWRYLGEYMDDAIDALVKDDWRAFKKSMIDYMEELGYKGCVYYNQFKRLSLKKISECFIKNEVDMSELWYMSVDYEHPNGDVSRWEEFYNTENEARIGVKSNAKELIQSYEVRGVKFEKIDLADDHAWLITTDGIHIKLNVRKWIVK